MTLPPTSVYVIVWCGDTPVVLRSLGDRCERHKRASRAWSARWPGSPKGRIESEPRGPSQLREMRGVARIRTVPIANRHDSSWFESFRYHFALFWSFWLAISEPGCTSRKKVPLEIRLKSTRPSHGRFWSRPLPREAKQNFLLPGLSGGREGGQPTPRAGRLRGAAQRLLAPPLNGACDKPPAPPARWPPRARTIQQGGDRSARLAPRHRRLFGRGPGAAPPLRAYEPKRRDPMRKD